MLSSGTRLFGTDGIRGVANTELTAELALQVGRAAGSLIEDGPVLVGRDTRRSGEMLSLAVQAGFHSAGCDTVDAGILPTGGISHLTTELGAELAVVVSASHNPAQDNGIKLLDGRGSKLRDEDEDQIEFEIRHPASKAIPVAGQVGTRFPLDDAAQRYVNWLAGTSTYTLAGISVTVDCANGAAFWSAPELLRRLKADVRVLCDTPDGVNINAGCGATHPEHLASRSIGTIGLAFDGDADRLVAVDEEGGIVNGDVIMAICARHMKAAGRLTGDRVVATVMSNLGFRRAMDEAGIEMIETKVGDRYVLEAMLANQVGLGGEQSGHLIFLDWARTGDGLLTAVRLLDIVAGTGKTLVELSREAMREYPQVLENVVVVRKHDLEAAASIWDAVAKAEAELGPDGRVLVRASGTEPLVRVMVEAPQQELATRYADAIAAVVAEELG